MFSESPRVFISYAREDEAHALALCDRLREHGISPWLDKNELLAGEEWADVIRIAIRQSDLVVICLSPRSVNKRGYIQREIRMALDCYLEIPPGQAYLIPALIEPILKNQADVVFGSRFLNNHRPKNMALPNLVCNKLLTLTTNLLFSFHTTDEATCYKVLRADLLKNMDLKCSRFEFCPEVVAKIGKMHARYAELPISYQGRTHTEGKKIGMKDAFDAFWTLFKYRFSN